MTRYYYLDIIGLRIAKMFTGSNDVAKSNVTAIEYAIWIACHYLSVRGSGERDRRREDDQELRHRFTSSRYQEPLEFSSLRFIVPFGQVAVM